MARLDDFGVHPLSLLSVLVGLSARSSRQLRRRYPTAPLGRRRPNARVETFDIARVLMQLDGRRDGLDRCSTAAPGGARGASPCRSSAARGTHRSTTRSG